MKKRLLVSSSLIAAASIAACSSEVQQSSQTTSASSSSVSSSSESASSSSSSGTGGSGGAASSDVTGSVIATFITEKGETQTPEAGIVISALVPKMGGFDTITGTVNPDGTFVIPNVPAGEFYVEIDYGGGYSSFVATTERKLDLGYDTVGRADTQYVQAPTKLNLTLDGLNAWQDSDQLEIFALGSDTWGDLAQSAPTPPMAGVTSLSGFPADISQILAPFLIEGSKGDQPFITQLQTQTTASMLTYSSVTKVFVPKPFDMMIGQPTNLMGSMADVPQKMLPVSFMETKFEAVVLAAAPNATFAQDDFYVYMEPGGKTRGTSSYSADLLELTDLTGGQDMKLDLAYGNPFPATWEPIAYADSYYAVAIDIPGSAMKRHVYPGTTVSAPLSVLAAGDIVPQLGLPTKATINGKDATSTVTGAGTSPTIAWTAPSMGKASLYYVYIRALGPGNTFRTVATIATADTSVTIPPGVLSKGDIAVARITAEATGNIAAPYRLNPSNASAALPTAAFTP